MIVKFAGEGLFKFQILAETTGTCAVSCVTLEVSFPLRPVSEENEFSQIFLPLSSWPIQALSIVILLLDARKEFVPLYKCF